MENIVRTVYGSLLQSALLLGVPLPVLANTTLNTKHGVQPSTVPIPTDRFVMKYLGIGNGGHRLVAGTNGISVPKPIQHRSTDASLYNQLPFVLRALNNDLSSVDRSKYALRAIKTINSVSYIAYYLKRLDFSAVIPSMELKTVTNGATATTVFTPTTSNLNPAPPALDTNGVVVTTGDYVAATSKIPFILTEAEVAEILNVANIISGDEGYAIISEIALVSGVDKVVTVTPTVGSPFNFNEVIAAQIVTFITSFFALPFNNGGVDVILDVGATEPLLTLS